MAKLTKLIQPIPTFVIHFILTFMLLGVLPGSISGATHSGRKQIFLSYEKRLVMMYLLAGTGETKEKQVEIIRRFTRTLTEFWSQKLRVLEARNFSDFLKIYLGNFPKSHSLESDLQIIEKQGVRGMVQIRAINTDGSANPVLQRKFDAFILSQNKELFDQASESPNFKPMALFAATAETIVKASADGNLLDKETLFSLALEGFARAGQVLDRQIALIDQTGDEIVLSGKMDGNDKAMTLFVQTVLKEYFKRLRLAAKKQILSRFMGNDLNSDAIKKFEDMIKSAGPLFQKLLQVVARDAGLSKDLLRVFKQLESDITPVPEQFVKDLFESERQNYNWASYKLKPLGTGTMAQNNAGSIKLGGRSEDIAIRFLKPEIEVEIEEDSHILKEIAPILDKDVRFAEAGFPKLVPIIEDLIQTGRDELNLEATIANQKLGRKAYSREVFYKGSLYRSYINVVVPWVLERPKGSKLIIQELVKGGKLDSVAEANKEMMPELKKIVIEQISKMWLDEVLFGSGFFHSDLHQGNFLVSVEESGINLSILDFGMGGVISHQMQVDLLTLGVALEVHRADVISEVLWSLSVKDRSQISYSDFNKAVIERNQMEKEGLLLDQSIDTWTVWAMNLGVRFPYSFVALNRGLKTIGVSLAESSDMTIPSIVKSLAMKHPRKMFAALANHWQFSIRDLIRTGWQLKKDQAAEATRKLNLLSEKSGKPDTSKTGNKNPWLKFRCESVLRTR